MAGQKGKDLLLLVGDGGGTEVFTAVAGMRSNGIKINNESVDVTNKSSAGVRELMAGGIQSFAASGSGVFLNDAGFTAVHTAVLANGDPTNFQVVVPGLGTYEGPFMISDFEITGEHNGEVTFSMSLDSANAISFT